MTVSLVRTLVLYVAVICAIRLMGKRQIGELEPSELVITILISELASIPMQDLGVPLATGLVPIAALISTEIIVSFLCLKSRRLRRLCNGRAAVLIYNGKVDAHHDRRNRRGPAPEQHPVDRRRQVWRARAKRTALLCPAA